MEEDDEEGRKFSVDSEDHHEDHKKPQAPTTSAFFDDE